MKIQLVHKFEDIISVDNLLEAWKEFVKGKRNKKDVQEFSFNLMRNVLELHRDLKNKTYRHGEYYAFSISDPKPRNIHKASVRDRLLHHAVYRILYPFFDKTFISDSFSCRKNKGTHKALSRLRSFNYIIGKNNTKTCWVLKCDVRKFFASINQKILVSILKQYISDRDIIWLLEEVIKSFSSIAPNTGLPLGNLTSQLFVNIYMNKFDQFAKHNLKATYYVRYADDFVFSSQDRNYLATIILVIENFLQNKLNLTLHPKKVFIKTLASGVDFLGWVNFPNHRVLRTTTKRRMLKRISKNPNIETVDSYLGLLSHGNSHKLKDKILLVSSLYYVKNKLDYNI